ncbi:GNAT family acetyltransferase [Paraglaciecola aquimarina]|uniref:GNAT family acetyltransferase n=1 Tax=Paraglaciecola aquimarina TaxID=1235557 RepID=A0ABU3SVT6_9ALTE|nr:GNAT family acetyltransferase [Paraglaciecola aquimarina]MDU0354134.1 GNAT family acetyltransferase [Paraglaciecola aquimarina]
MSLKLKVATLENVAEVLTLHYKYQVDSISEQDKQDGFITTAFTESHLTRLIEDENGLFIAIKNDKIVAYAMSASWQFWCQWPMFQYMVDNLDDSTLNQNRLTIDNSYQYGPVCVDKSVRGQGVFEEIFNFSLQNMAKRYPFMVTFINKINTRSYQAHTRKVQLNVINEFSFNNNQYFKLACNTH